MKDRKTGLSIKTAKDSAGKKAAMKALLEDDYLTGEMANLRMDVDKRIHRAAKSLANATTTNEGKSVSIKMLVTEGLLDLFKKYKDGGGKYEFDSEWDWQE